MKKHIVFLLAFLILLTGCTLALAETAATQAPELTDLTSLLSMTRADVEVLYGPGEADPYSSFGDFNESSDAIFGFRYLYSTLSGIVVFYDAVPPDRDAEPYVCVESPDDPVMGIKLASDCTLFQVGGFSPTLNAESIATLTKEYKTEIEHVNGLYEYYRLYIQKDGVQYIWDSETADMANSALYAMPVKAESK